MKTYMNRVGMNGNYFGRNIDTNLHQLMVRIVTTLAITAAVMALRAIGV